MRVIALSLSLLVGCGASSPPPQSPPAEAAPVWTGDVSEEAFRDLHALREDTAPPLRGEDITIGGVGRAYLSLPEGEARSAVIVIHEWWGLNDHIRHWADRLAADGHAALAIDLYGGEVATTPDAAMELVRAVDEAEARGTLEAAVTFLREDPRVAATERRGVIGWCFGGGWALEAGLALEGLDAVVMYYGRPVLEVDRLRGLDAPLLGVFGNQDDSIPPARVDEFEAALEAAGVEHRILRFDAPHAFANPSSDRYVHDAASEAWEAVRAFLHAELRPQ